MHEDLTQPAAWLRHVSRYGPLLRRSGCRSDAERVNGGDRKNRIKQINGLSVEVRYSRPEKHPTRVRVKFVYA